MRVLATLEPRKKIGYTKNKMSTDRESGRGNKRARVTRGLRNPKHGKRKGFIGLRKAEKEGSRRKFVKTITTIGCFIITQRHPNSFVESSHMLLVFTTTS
jgi:hypothetical protein